jgi:hypothetical protein
MILEWYLFYKLNPWPVAVFLIDGFKYRLFSVVSLLSDAVLGIHGFQLAALAPLVGDRAVMAGKYPARPGVTNRGVLQEQ